MAATRIMREIAELARDPPPGISAALRDGQSRVFDVLMQGPTGTPFENGAFKLELKLPDEYPVKPPVVRFITKVFHPNIRETNGEICIDVLKDKWTAVMGIQSALVSVQALLSVPNPLSPLNVEAARLWKSDKNAAEMTARSWVRTYATI